MIVFCISMLTAGDKLADAIKANYPENHIQITPTFWLVAGSGTAQEVSNKLGLTVGGMGSAIIFATSGYYGRAPSNVWEWVQAKMEASTNG